MNQDTFCSAPWFRLRINWDGQYRPCCEFKIEKSDFDGQKNYSLHNTTVKQWMISDYSQYLRKHLTQGDKLPECSVCWEKEQHGMVSLRQTVNDTVTNNRGHDLDNTWVKLFVKKYPDSYRILSADVKLSNVCNFSCVMCDPHNSSKIYDQWHNDINNKFVQKHLAIDPMYFDTIKQNYQTQRGHQHLIDLLLEPITHLKLLGGEPLLDKMLFQILTEQPLSKKSQVHLHFITNGSISLVDTVNRLKDYKSVSFSVSLEGIGAIQDYARSGSNWNFIEQNIINAHLQGISVSIAHTIQAATVLKLPDLLNWCHTNKIAINLNMLDNPDYLAVSVLPQHIQSEIINNLEKVSHIKLLSPNNNEDNNILSVDSIMSIIKTQSKNSEKYLEFLEYIKWYERDLATKLVDICPLLSH
jgi:molybdenum cofactor biosynthesis enzyme MoaA